MKLIKSRLQRFKAITTILFLFILLLPFTNYQLLITDAYAAIPRLINYQGKLTNAQGQPITGTINITFKIYDVESCGAPLWTEPYTGLTIDKGIFNVMLGGQTALNLAFDKPYYLGIQVGSDTEMTPRQRLASSAYAFTAENGVPKGTIVMWSGSIASIPAGWALCDGSHGTPDLRDKFIVCARQDDSGITKTNITGSLTKSGGSTTIDANNLPAHTHAAGSLATNSAGAHNHVCAGSSGEKGGSGPYTQLSGSGIRGRIFILDSLSFL